MNGFRLRSREAEEKIPVQSEIYFVVDCPSLHLIPSTYLVPRKHQISEVGLLARLRRTTADEPQGVWAFEKASCPQCRQVITKTRQIPSACFPDDLASRSMTSLTQTLTQYSVLSPAPTPVPSPGTGMRPTRFIESRPEGRPESVQSTPSNSSMSPPPRWGSPLPTIDDLRIPDIPIPEFRPFTQDWDVGNAEEIGRAHV